MKAVEHNRVPTEKDNGRMSGDNFFKHLTPTRLALKQKDKTSEHNTYCSLSEKISKGLELSNTPREATHYTRR